MRALLFQLSQISFYHCENGFRATQIADAWIFHKFLIQLAKELTILADLLFEIEYSVPCRHCVTRLALTVIFHKSADLFFLCGC